MSSTKTRIGIAIDSTGSMGETINAVKNKVMAMIERLAKTYRNQFQIQILFYYGDNTYDLNAEGPKWDGTNRLHVSPWSDDVNILKDFL